MVPPHPEQVHLDLSFSRNGTIPESRMHLRFSIMLMRYFVRYLLSSCFSLLHGKSLHSKQKEGGSSWNVAQFLILHFQRVTGLLSSGPLQPGHLFLSRRYATQIPQFIPQGAISEVLSGNFTTSDRHFLFCSAAPTVMVITGMTRYRNPIWVK